MKIRFERNKTSTVIVMYSLYLYFLGLSLRNTSKALVIFKDEKRSHVAAWKWIQRFGSFSSQIYKRKKYLLLLSMKLLSRLVISISGYGLQLNQFTLQCLVSTFQRKETCLLLKNSLDL